MTRPRLHPPDTGQRLYALMVAGCSLTGAAGRLDVPRATARRLALEYAERAGLPWPPGCSTGARCYEAFVRLGSWNAVAAEVLPDTGSRRPGAMALKLAKRWARGTAGQPRAAWPVQRPEK